MSPFVFVCSLATVIVVISSVLTINAIKEYSKKRDIKNKEKEAMSNILEAAKKCKSAVVVLPEEEDIPVYEKLVSDGKIKRNPLGSGYMLTDDYEKIWSKIPSEHVHAKFEPDDGVLTRDVDPKTGKLVPVITEDMVLNNKEKVNEIIKNKINEIEKIKPKIEEEKRRIIGSIMTLKEKEK